MNPCSPASSALVENMNLTFVAYLQAQPSVNAFYGVSLPVEEILVTHFFDEAMPADSRVYSRLQL